MTFSLSGDYYDNLPAPPDNVASDRDVVGGLNQPSLPDMGPNLPAIADTGQPDANTKRTYGPGDTGWDPNWGPPPGASQNPNDSQPVGPIADARKNWDPNWGPPPGGSRTGTLNGAIDLTSPAGQIDLKTGQPYVPTAAELGPYAPQPPTPTPAAGTPTPTPTLPDLTTPHQLSGSQWQDEFTKREGYFDPNYNSKDNLLYNAQRGDLNVRPQLEDMANMGDTDAKRVLDAIRATPGFDQGPQSADWRNLHNAEITLREKAMLAGTQAGAQGYGGQGINGGLGAHPQAASGGGNQAAVANLEAQRVREIVPGSLEATLPAAAELAKLLTNEGAQAVHYDPTTNKLTWQGTDGINRTLGGMDQAGLLDWANAAAKLKDGITQQQQQAAAAASNGYGGGYGGGYRGPRGNGGYTPPPQAPAPNVGIPPQPTYKGNEIIPTQWGGYNPPGIIRPY